MVGGTLVVLEEIVLISTCGSTDENSVAVVDIHAGVSFWGCVDLEISEIKN